MAEYRKARRMQLRARIKNLEKYEESLYRAARIEQLYERVAFLYLMDELDKTKMPSATSSILSASI